jgi:hypothetical protein
VSRVDPVIVGVAADKFHEDDSGAVFDCHDEPEFVAADIEHHPFAADDAGASLDFLDLN